MENLKKWFLEMIFLNIRNDLDSDLKDEGLFAPISQEITDKPLKAWPNMLLTKVFDVFNPAISPQKA